MAEQVFEPMSVGQILDRTFRLYRRDFLHFVTVVAVVQVPIGLVGLALAWLQNSTIVRDAAGRVMGYAPGAAGLLIVVGLAATFLGVLGRSLCSGALVKSVSEAYLGNDVSVGQAYRFVLPKLGSLIWASILVGVVVMLGLVLLVVPGVIFSLWLALTTPAIIVEGRSASAAMGRSKKLTSGNLGKVFGVGATVFIIGISLASMFTFGGGFVANMVSPMGTLANVTIRQVCAVVAQVLAAPIGATAIILLYYDLRIRKEAFDLEMLAETMGSGEA